MKKASNNKEKGRLGEKLALNHLKKKGLKIYARNYSTPIGEIDLICKEGETFVFVEVKTRSSALSDPFDSITAKKRLKMIKIAQYFLAAQKNDADIRFDVVGITIIDKKTSIEHIENAFISES